MAATEYNDVNFVFALPIEFKSKKEKLIWPIKNNINGVTNWNY